MSYTSILVHYVFATHERRPLVSDELQPKLWAYMGEIARTNGMKALAIGGMRDHVHDDELKMILKRHGMVPLGE